MPLVSRRLLLVAVIGFLVTIWFLFLQPDPYAPLRPSVSPQQAKLIAQEVLQKVGVLHGQSLPNWQVTQEEDGALERYLQRQGLTDEYMQRYGKIGPPVVWKVVSAQDPHQEVDVNQQTGRVEALHGLSLSSPPLTNGAEASGISSLLMEEFHCRMDSNIENQSGRNKTLTVCGSDFSFHGIQTGIEWQQTGGVWTGFTHRVMVPARSSTNGQAIESVAGLFNLYVLAFPLFGLVVYFFRPNALAGRRWGTPLLAGGLTLLGVWLQDGTVQALANGLIAGVAVVAVMQIVYRGRSDVAALLRTPGWALHRVWLGYCLFAIQAGVGALFTGLALHVGAWMSPVQGKEMILLSRWPLVLPLATGLAASLFEELVFRKWADHWLRRLIGSTWVIGLVSSLLWSVGHLGYEVDPWYLRIIELGLVVGPLSFWMYRRYGLFATVLAHFLYNLFVTCHDVVSVYGAGVSGVYLYLLTPCLLLVRPFWRRSKRPLANIEYK